MISINDNPLKIISDVYKEYSSSEHIKQYVDLPTILSKIHINISDDTYDNPVLYRYDINDCTQICK